MATTYEPETVPECQSAETTLTAYVASVEAALNVSPLIPHPSRFTGTAPTGSSSYNAWCDWLWSRHIDYIDDCTYLLEQHQRPIPPRPSPRPVPPRPTPRPLPLPPSPVHPWVS